MTGFEYLEQRWAKAPIVCNNPGVKFPHKPGQKLPNGGIIMDEEIIREFDHRRDSLVLCLVPNSYQPFVSWIRTVVTDSPLASGGFQIRDYCEYGHYDSDLVKAVMHFTSRVAEKKELLDV